MTEETKEIDNHCNIIDNEIVNRNFISVIDLKTMLFTNILMCVNSVSKKKVIDLSKRLQQTKLILKSINEEVGGNSKSFQEKSSELRINLKQNVGLFNATRDELKRIYLAKWMRENYPTILNEFYIDWDKEEKFNNPEYDKKDLKLIR